MNSWQVSVAAESVVACMFARCGYDVSVQYGANQPEYDLIVAKRDKMLKVSVKGSQDGGWGLSQSYINKADYHKAADDWLKKHYPKTVLCFVQFENVSLTELPRIYLATPHEVANRLKDTRSGKGDTILYEYKEWSKRAVAFGTIEKIPDSWKFSEERIEELFKKV